jgi:hypothetical protein
MARNLKLILAAFEQLSGLKINFHQSELFCFGEVQNKASQYADLFVVGRASFLFVIWGFRFIFEDLQLPNGNPLRKDYKNISVVGKGNCYP